MRLEIKKKINTRLKFGDNFTWPGIELRSP
jgi:hypothetical protein